MSAFDLVHIIITIIISIIIIITIIMYDLLETLCGKVSGCVEGANNSQMKEIRGLGDRLSGLEQLLLDAKRKVKKSQFCIITNLSSLR